MKVFAQIFACFKADLELHEVFYTKALTFLNNDESSSYSHDFLKEIGDFLKILIS